MSTGGYCCPAGSPPKRIRSCRLAFVRHWSSWFVLRRFLVSIRVGIRLGSIVVRCSHVQVRILLAVQSSGALLLLLFLACLFLLPFLERLRSATSHECS